MQTNVNQQLSDKLQIPNNMCKLANPEWNKTNHQTEHENIMFHKNPNDLSHSDKQIINQKNIKSQEITNTVHFNLQRAQTEPKIDCATNGSSLDSKLINSDKNVSIYSYCYLFKSIIYVLYCYVIFKKIIKFFKIKYLNLFFNYI